MTNKKTLTISSKGALGGNCGQVSVHGSKNCLLNTLFLPLLVDQPVRIANVPLIRDIDKNIEILEKLGANVSRSANELLVDCSNVHSSDLSLEDAQATTGSKFLIPLLTAKFGSMKTYPSGGDKIGDRGFQNYADLIKKFGIDHVVDAEGAYSFSKSDNFDPVVSLPFPSFGLTVLAILCGMRHEKEFTLHNISVEPEIENFCEVIQLFGVRLTRIDHRSIVIEPDDQSVKLEFSNMMDRNVAVTYCIAALAKRRAIELLNFENVGFGAFFDFLSELGVDYEISDGKLSLHGDKFEDPKKDITTLFHIFPMLHSDWNAMISILLSQLSGSHYSQELLFENRMQHWDELSSLGLRHEEVQPRQTRLSGLNKSCVAFTGVQKLVGGKVRVPDLRSGAAILIAASLVNGQTRVSNFEEIDRGYENLFKQFGLLFDDFEFSLSD